MALILSLGGVELLKLLGVPVLNEPWPALAVGLFLALLLSIAIQLALIPFALRPQLRLSRALSKEGDRKNILKLDPDDFPGFEQLIASLQANILWGEQQSSTASVINQAIRAKALSAERDNMTGLYSKPYLYNYLPDNLARSKTLNEKITMLMIDIDHFKHYNDTNGHPAGDKVLIKVAELLQKNVRDMDICVRFGGEEFMVVLPKSSSSRAQQTAERLRAAIQSHDFPQGDKQPLGHITVSIGIATFPDQANSMEELIERADKALYISKQYGRNRVSIYGDDPAKHIIDDDFDIEMIDGGA